MNSLQRQLLIQISSVYSKVHTCRKIIIQRMIFQLSRFVGICIDRGGCGLRAWFILRNVVEGQGVEFMYQMYNPTLVKIEVLRLERRLDEELYYLR